MIFEIITWVLKYLILKMFVFGFQLITCLEIGFLSAFYKIGPLRSGGAHHSRQATKDVA